ncbi:MAG: XRE family transcriptional regulator [Clostridium sp.]
MNHNITIGAKVKALRISKNYTLKQLSEGTGLSVGFLSQMERGISSIAIDSLAKIADVLNFPLANLFDSNAPVSQDPIVHGYNLECTKATPEIVQYILSNNSSEYDILPRLFHLMPQAGGDKSEVVMLTHVGEEFIYILEGIVTVCLREREYILYPGDSIQIHSNERHNWINRTNKVAKLLSINSPNPFKSALQKNVPFNPDDLKNIL